MPVTISDRFIQNTDGSIWDNLLSKKYSSLDELLHILNELNNYVSDFEEEINRQAGEINALIGDLENEDV